MADNLKTLNKERASVKTQMTRLQNYLKTHTIDVDDLRVRRAKLEELSREFHKIQIQIDVVQDREEEDPSQAAFEEQYYDCAKTLNRIERELQETRTDEASGTSLASDRASPMNVRSVHSLLPKIEIPNFDGNPTAWHNFHDTFKSIVHDSCDIPAVQKFHLLKNALRGEMTTVIASLNATEENYQVAWGLLLKRCNRPRQIIQAHLKALLGLSDISKDSPSNLRTLTEQAQMHVNALRALKLPVWHWDAFLVYIIIRKVDANTRRHWERSLENEDMPTFKDLIEFLTNQARGDEIELIENSLHKQSRFSRNLDTKGLKRAPQNYLGTQVQCAICRQAHTIYTCPQFRNLHPRDRADLARKSNLCLNCLRANHSTSKCNLSGCRICQKHHNTLLHFPDSRTREIGTARSLEAPQEQALATPVDGHVRVKEQPHASTERKCLNATYDSEVLLGTAIVTIVDKFNQPHDCRVLLDSGSQSNFITEKLAEQLGLAQTSIEIPFADLGQQQTKARYIVSSTIRSKTSQFSTDLSLVALPSITSLLPARQIRRQAITIPHNIKLADPEFHKPAGIDVLLGNSIFYNLIRVGQIKQANSSVILQKTRLGWIVTGEIKDVGFITRPPTAKTAHNVTTLEQQVARFWELEQVPVQKYFSPEELECEQHYANNTQRDNGGRYIVRLPFRKNKELLGDSYQIALKRFLSLEQRLSKDSQMGQQYSQFLREYLQLGHMTDISEEHDRNEGCYLPHQPVIKESSNTTKIRVVFNGSAKGTNNLSLNDTLMVGPTIQDDLVVIIMRFRMHKFVLTADIEKMFRQIRIPDTDAIYQKIIWREHPTKPLKVFRLDTVTYGTASAPFLAVRTLKQLAKDEAHSFPLGADILQNDFYVDDLLTGTDDYVTALKLRTELTELLKRGGFNLRQWSSNDARLIDEANIVEGSFTVPLDRTMPTRVLGTQWNPEQDTIGYSVQNPEQVNRVTKRTILSRTAQLFDPLGLLGPVITKAKIIIQQVWKEKLDWDETVPSHICLAWAVIERELPLLEKLKLPRRVTVDDTTRIELHGFADASEIAYGACLYVRSTNKDQQYSARLICAKSRVAPIKTITLPRLELCAAQLLARLYKLAANALKIKFDAVRLWTDSTIVLHWINTPPHQLKTFVANRVADIQTLTVGEQWYHVPTRDNPADYISRGQNPSEFIQNRQWISGPSWLLQDNSTWPVTQLDSITPLPELRTKVALVTSCKANNTIWENFSSIIKLNRFVAYALRLVARRNNTTKGTQNLVDLTTDELNDAHLRIIKLVQLETFANAISQLGAGKTLHPKDKLLPLNPFIDERGIMRVGGRLKNAPISFAQKHPILLPKSHHITTLIIRHYHEQNWHSGTLATLNSTRQKYWVIDGKSTVGRVIHDCIRCRKFNPRIPRYIMGNLPGSRVTLTRPFENTGVDYCGPFYIKEKKHRNTKKVKAYVAIFVCFCTKAVHIELVTELTTEAFLGAIRRFFGRRGKASNIYSDNASNFVGANREQKELLTFIQSDEYNKGSRHALANEGITWHFSPPRSPHFGGLWEAAVKAFKKHFYITVGSTLFTYEQFNTLVIEIEAILNSRPLTALSPDPNDLSALTPGHFLIGDNLRSIPDHDWLNTPRNRLSVYQHLQKIKQHFWTRWKRDYLNQLHTRSKWHLQDERSIAVGDIVTIKEENTPPLHWTIGRIVATHPGDDGVVRVATVKTSSGIYKRSIKLLCPLLTEIIDTN